MSWLPLPNVLPTLLARKLRGITQHKGFLMRGIRSSFFKWPSLRNSYHSNMEWVPYQRKIIHLRNGQITTVNQSRSQQSSWPSNHPRVKRSHPVRKIMTLLCCSIFLGCKTLKHENPIIIHKKNKWYESNHNNNICNI